MMYEIIYILLITIFYVHFRLVYSDQNHECCNKCQYNTLSSKRCREESACDMEAMCEYVNDWVFMLYICLIIVY